MIGDTLSVTYDGSAIVLPRINQDNFSAEYMKQVGTVIHRVRVFHNRENARGNTLMERHRVEYTRTEKDLINGDRTFSSVSVIRAPDGADRALLEKAASAQLGIMTATLIGKLVGWES